MSGGFSQGTRRQCPLRFRGSSVFPGNRRLTGGVIRTLKVSQSGLFCLIPISPGRVSTKKDGAQELSRRRFNFLGQLTRRAWPPSAQHTKPLALCGFRHFSCEVFFFLLDAIANGHAHESPVTSTPASFAASATVLSGSITKAWLRSVTSAMNFFMRPTIIFSITASGLPDSFAMSI